MADKALISELTWRSLEMQKHAFPDMPHFIAPDELSSLLRHTRRAEQLVVHVMSLAVIADKEKDFIAFYEALRKIKAKLISLDDGMTANCNAPVGSILIVWRDARKQGAAKVGGQISADKRKAKSAAGATLIKDRWGMPSKICPTHVLLKEADISYNTAITILGKRPIAQYNYQAKLTRKKRLQGKYANTKRGNY